MKEKRMAIVEQALEKASICEKKGDEAGVKKWLDCAERAEQAYRRARNENKS